MNWFALFLALCADAFLLLGTAVAIASLVIGPVPAIAGRALLAASLLLMSLTSRRFSLARSIPPASRRIEALVLLPIAQCLTILNAVTVVVGIELHRPTMVATAISAMGALTWLAMHRVSNVPGT